LALSFTLRGKYIENINSFLLIILYSLPCSRGGGGVGALSIVLSNQWQTKLCGADIIVQSREKKLYILLTNERKWLWKICSMVHKDEILRFWNQLSKALDVILEISDQRRKYSSKTIKNDPIYLFSASK